MKIIKSKRKSKLKRKLASLERYSDTVIGSKKKKYHFAGGTIIAKDSKNALRQMRIFLRRKR